MKRRRKPRPQVSHDRWLVSYADFITLLFAFFVVLYASSQMDYKKAAKMAHAIRGGFSNMGSFGPSRQNAAPDKMAAGAVVSNPGLDHLINDMADKTQPIVRDVPVSVVKHQLESALEEEIRKKQVSMRISPDGLVISLSEVGFFNSGEAQILPAAQPVLERIGKVLAERGFDFRVEGHTDNVPIHNSVYRSNWELSTARATEVVSVLVSKYDFDPTRIAVAGNSQYRPIASNDTEEGRTKNRRIDMVVLANTGLENEKPSPSLPTR